MAVYGESDMAVVRRGRTIAKVAAGRKLLTLVYYGLRDGHIRCLAPATGGDSSRASSSPLPVPRPGHRGVTLGRSQQSSPQIGMTPGRVVLL